MLGRLSASTAAGATGQAARLQSASRAPTLECRYVIRLPALNPRKRQPLLGEPKLRRGFLGVFAYSHRALELVWTTSRTLTIAFAILTLIAGTLPAAVAYLGALIVDAVVAAIQADAIDRAALTQHALMLRSEERRVGKEW